ncbi:MAG: hypothetical protein AAF750_18275 [Planctomycetota bacterium]
MSEDPTAPAPPQATPHRQPPLSVSGTFHVTNGNVSKDSKETVEDFFYHYTKNIGSIIRQFALAGVAFIWLLHTSGLDPEPNHQIDNQYSRIGPVVIVFGSGSVPEGHGNTRPDDPYKKPLDKLLLWSGVFILLSLILEVIRYAVGSHCFSRKFKDNPNTPVSSSHDFIQVLFYGLISSVAAALIGFILLAIYLGPLLL